MNIVTITNEGRRGCGFRKEGGLYLMAGGPSAPCGKLPYILERCPCCDQGIKQSRGWTWVNGKLLFGQVECKADPSARPCNGGMCILAHPPEKMGLLWIGEKFYKTPQEFLREGMAQGISRRISAIPREFKLGETWVLFAHAKAVLKDPAELVIPPRAAEYVPGIFGCFQPSAIQYIVKADDSQEKLEALEKRGITLVRLVRTDGAELFEENDGQPDEQKENEDFAHDDELSNLEASEIL